MKKYAETLTFIILLAVLSIFTIPTLFAKDYEQQFKPFILAKIQKGDLEEISQSVSKSLLNAGFRIVGSFSPYENALIIVITNDIIRHSASMTEFGGFGAVQRVTLTKVGEQVQISYTNPEYMSHVYRFKNELSDVASILKTTLGNENDYGSKEGLTEEQLREYQYKWLMPYFSDRIELASYKSLEDALRNINQYLLSSNSGAEKVYQLQISDNDTVIGVHLTGNAGNQCSGDKYIMERIDFKEIKSTGHLPYEIVVSKGKVYTLPAEFRIAINFPDLSMVGSNSFASIMCAPADIESALVKATGGQLEDD